MDYRDVVSIVSILLSGTALVILLTQRKSMGCFTERVERAQEGTRRSNELKRQSDERLRDEIKLQREERQLARDEGIAIFNELMKMQHECKHAHNGHHTERSA